MNLPSTLTSQLNRFSKPTRELMVTVAIGLGGGLAAVAFNRSINFIYEAIWPRLAAGDLWGFLGWSLLVMIGVGAISGWLLSAFCPEAAGSGIPQVKLAFWRDSGFVSLRAGIVKFVAGALTIGGGASLGREGPSVHLSGSLASNIAGWLGVPKHGRRSALAAGAAAGLAAAFNTPISAITFVLEEVIEDLNSARYLGHALLAAVLATFVTHLFLGSHPAFVIPIVQSISWKLYLLAPIVAALAAVIGAWFQLFTLGWRERIKTSPIPTWARPMVGMLITWALGCAVFVLTLKLYGHGRLGVFSLGYPDLTDILHNNMLWKVALLLLVAKFVATVASYAWGGCGGIFAPTLFLGAAFGLGISEAISWIFPLWEGDRIALAVVGMSACLGAVVRAPITSILIVFEMTHEFTFVPVLLLGTLASQLVSRWMTKDNFYTDVLARDGHDLARLIPPRTLEEYRQSRLGTVANFKPVCVTSLDHQDVKHLLEANAYLRFPVVLEGALKGTVTRGELDLALREFREPRIDSATTATPDETLAVAQTKLIHSNHGLLVVLHETTGAVLGLMTLHDLFRVEENFAKASEG